VVWPCGKKTKTGGGSQKGEKKRQRNTKEDCVIDVARRKGKTLAEMKRLSRDRIAFRQWTEDPTLQGNRDR
jgi:hypothetical protein